MIKRKKDGRKSQRPQGKSREMEKPRMSIVFTGIPVNAEKELFIRFVLDFLSNTPIRPSPNPPLDSCVHSSLPRVSFMGFQ